jgi:hypothetical protein
MLINTLNYHAVVIFVMHTCCGSDVPVICNCGYTSVLFKRCICYILLFHLCCCNVIFFVRRFPSFVLCIDVLGVPSQKSRCD